MQRRKSPAGVITILVSLIVLFGCNQIPGDNDKKGNAAFDTGRAAQSVIPISKAVKYQQSFVNSRQELMLRLAKDSFFLKKFNLPNGEAFTKDLLLLLLSQKDADGIRFYYGRDSAGVIRLVLLPIRKDGSVIYTKLTGTSKSGNANTTADSSAGKANAMNIQDGNEAGETGQTCPPCLINPLR